MKQLIIFFAGMFSFCCHAQNVGIATPLPPTEKLEVNGNIKFTDNGQIISADVNHRILFRRTENKMELREYGKIILSTGASNGNQTGTMSIAANGIGIGTTTPNAASILDITSTSKGFLPPRMKNVQQLAIPNPAPGLMVFCKDCGTYGELQMFNGNTWLNMAGKPAAIHVPVGTVTVGQSLGGGKVAYIVKFYEPGYDAAEAHGIIAAPADLPDSMKWNNGINLLSPVAVYGLHYGDGSLNTKELVNLFGPGNYAANLCSNYVTGKYYDWHLPSIDELGYLYASKDILGGFAAGTYWSSTQGAEHLVWTVPFNVGPTQTITFSNVASLLHVRAIRYF